MQADRFETQPTLAGPSITVRPALGEDFEAVFMAAADPAVWAQHPSPNRYRRQVFKTEFWDSAAQTGGLLMVLENQTGQCIGSSRFYQWNPADRSVVIGYTFLVTRHWGGPTNTELKALMLEHAFKTACSVWFHIGSNNRRSRRAVEKLGARFSHERVTEAGGQPHVVVHYRLDGQPRGP
ncbi:MAG: N-acetyltransferase [Betaproteobacteria bacterium]|nr:N-acetyltransferase [Betaproteobacteria bacterium]NBT11828.1 N-acetyltransferase [Betaproteobacteria bacterium]NBU48522.1 N-acetyltransferase [Betaproteobacteria bacterium]